MLFRSYLANDIVYYEAGKDFTYGEGTEQDAHSPEEAAAHTVVHITQPGAYRLSGQLTLGQVAVDLGEDAKKDPQAVVTLVLEGLDISCQVAPAIIFYNVYECGNDDADQATKDVDTTAAGANVVIADNTVNLVNGAYVARIYKPDSVVLNEDKTAVEDAKKLHKYDAAFYSKRSMNIFGEADNSGILRIQAENEGLDSEMHLTLNGGNIQIQSGNDGINTNEDGISVTTVNGGSLYIKVTGETGEGDGIDSNGWLVINGGTVTALACSNSADAGIDSDMGIHINGGTVLATGNMLDQIEGTGQNYAVFSFAQTQSGGETVTLKAQDDTTLLEATLENAYSILIYSNYTLVPGTYHLYSGGKQLAGTSGGMGGMGGGMMGRPGGMQPNMQPGEMTPPDRPNGAQQLPQGQQPPTDFTMPNDFTMPQGGRPDNFNGTPMNSQESSPEFIIQNGGNMFSGIAPVSA